MSSKVRFIGNRLVMLTVLFSNILIFMRLAKRGGISNIKKVSFSVILINFLAFSSYATEANSSLSESMIASSPVLTTSNLANDNFAVNLLNKMNQSVLHNDYKLYFIIQDENQYPISFEYTYLGSQKIKLAALQYLEDSPKEIILHDDIVSYFFSDRASFSIATNHIIEVFPEVIYSDFDNLVDDYDFVNLGKARIANRSSQLIRIIPKDKDRYNYVIWIDDENFLPLRIDLLDLNSKIINQIKVILAESDFDKQKFKDSLKGRDYPILYPIQKEGSNRDDWQVTWLPKGFKETDAYNINFQEVDIDTRHFSDGIFSFTINVSERSNYDKTHLSIQSDRTVYSYNKANMNIVIIGNLPIDTIKKIAQNINFK